MSTSQTSTRIHALDNLRAIMMWLGIVLHVAVNHMAGPSLLPFKDSETTPLADLTLAIIHSFRMPVFFILAAYLAAMMVETRGYPAMLRNRLRRIGLPFAVFWPVLLVAMGMLILVFRHQMFYGMLGLSVADAPPKNPHRSPFTTMHMWFMYYLFLFCMLAGLACALEKYVPAGLKSGLRRMMDALAGNWWGFAVLAVPLAIVGSGYRMGIVAVDGSFVPNIGELINHGMFFLYGWTLYRCRAVLLPSMAKHGWKFAAAGLPAFLAWGFFFKAYTADPASIPHIEALLAYAYGCTSWLWSIALIGLFLRYLRDQNRVLRYISESSYWVFLVHMVGTIGFGALLYNAPLGAVAKMGVNIAATTIACLLTYHLFVRSTWLGVLLNGKRISKNAPEGASVPA